MTPGEPIQLARFIQPAQLEHQVYEALKAAFSAVIAAHLEQTFYTFGLWTDDSLQFLHPAANTEEALTDTVARYRGTVDPQSGSTTTRAAMRWAWGDWGFFPIAGTDARFREINEAFNANFHSAPGVFTRTAALYWPAILRGFQRLEAEGFFGTGPARSSITLLLLGDLPEHLIHAWVSALNPPDVAAAYIHWNWHSSDHEPGE